MTVRCQDALAYLRVLPSQASRHCIYADPPYIFPGRSMNYYGARRRGHDLAFHSELRDALFVKRPALPCEHHDVPEAWELYSRAGSITRLLGQERLQARAAGSGPGQSCVWRRNGWGNPAASAGLRLQSGLPGPHQVDGLDLATSELRESILQLCRTTSVWSEVGFPTSVEMARSDRSRGAGLAFPSLLRAFRPQKSGDIR